MTRFTSLVVATVVAVLVVAQAGAAPAPKAQDVKPQAANAAALPNVDELHQLYRDGNYKETLQKLSRVLALKGDAAKAYDRHDLLRLRAETQLKLRDAAGAAATFEQAAKESHDDKARAVDVASQAVIKRSKNLQFIPAAKKGAKGAAKAEPIDVGDPEKRKEAFIVLFAEQKDLVVPRVKAAKDAKTLPPVIEALQAAGALRTLELAATGDDAEVKAMVADLSGRAQKMMADAVKDMTDTVAQIEESANRLQEVMTPVRNPGGIGGGGGVYAERSYRKRGLMTPDVKDLKRVISDCQKMVPAVKGLVDKLGEAGEEFKQIGKDAVAVGTKAHEVLTADYANSYTRSPRDRRRGV